jgi:hypothetical protein
MSSLRLSAAATGLPISVLELAAAAGLQRPISLRELLRKTGSRTVRIRVCVLRYDWQKPRLGVTPGAKWPDAFFQALYNGPDGWSISSYWNRCTFGLIDLQFEFQPWRMLPHDQAQDGDDRGGILRICKEQARADGVKLETFDKVVAFVHPPPNNAGASDGDAVFDQGGSIEFFEHEMGHVLGYQHAFGARGFSEFGAFDPAYGGIGDDVYEDPWCVMGFTGPQSRPVVPPPPFSGVGVVGDFWASGRRLSSAALYRHSASTSFSATPSAFEIRPSGDPRNGLAQVTLAAASEGRLLDPVVAVVPGDHGRICVEYRTRSVDDAGILPSRAAGGAVIVHTIGRRPQLAWETEDQPVWLEAVIPVDFKSDAWVSNVWSADPKSLHIQPMAPTPDGRAITVWLTRENQP